MTTSKNLALAALVIAGCKGKGEDGATQAVGKGSGSATLASGGGSGSGSGGGGGSGSGSGGGSGSAAAGGAVRTTPPAAAQLAEADVRAVVTAWLDAQNTGAFATYETLYAARMEGVKRVGPRTRSFDRAGWLADRKRMFGKPMTVTADDVAVQIAGATAEVSLVQGFAQGKFRDRGPKRMIVVKEAGALRIAREEMLASELGTTAAVAPSAALGAVRLVAEYGKPYVVLDTSADAAWGAGPLGPPLEAGSATLHLQAAPGTPEARLAWARQPLRGYAADGTACDVTVGAPQLAGGGTLHFGTEQLWDDADENGLGRAYTDAERAAERFAIGTPKLVAELTVPAACTPVFVAPASLSPKIFAPTEDAAISKAAGVAFRRLRAYTEVQRTFIDDFAGKGPWAPDLTIQVFGAAGGPRYVSAGAQAGNGCGEFEGSLWALWRVEASGAVTLVSSGDDPNFDAQAVFDLDGDGQVEVVGDSASLGAFEELLRQIPGGLDRVLAVEYSFLDCSC